MTGHVDCLLRPRSLIIWIVAKSYPSVADKFLDVVRRYCTLNFDPSMLEEMGTVLGGKSFVLHRHEAVR